MKSGLGRNGMTLVYLTRALIASLASGGGEDCDVPRRVSCGISLYAPASLTRF